MKNQTEIRACIDPGAVDKVTRFFNASTEQTLQEILQNARRSGATTVEITTEDDGRLSITDDGTGIDDPAALLAFGRSAWAADTRHGEDPAGMGVYALARTTATIASRPNGARMGWQVELEPDHYTGRKAATVVDAAAAPAPSGTRISFLPPDARWHARRAPASGDREAAAKWWLWVYGNAIRAAVRHYPLPVTINGKPAEQQEFLGQALYRRRWRGLEIGVFDTETHCGEPNLNFHGHAIRMEIPTVPTLLTQWHARIDVRRCPELELVLPARQEIVQSDFSKQLQEEARKTILQAMGVEAAVAGYRVFDKAREAGIALPVPAPALCPWEPQTARWDQQRDRSARRPVRPTDLLMDAHLDASDEQLLAYALKGTQLRREIHDADTRLEGYEWYDHLGRITRMDIDLVYGAETIRLRRPQTKWPRVPATRPKAVRITLAVDRGGRKSNLHLDSDVAFVDTNDHAGCPDGAGIVLTETARIDQTDLEQLVIASFFSPDDGADADSNERQKAEFAEAARDAALRLLATPEQRIKQMVRNGIEDTVRKYVPRHSNATIRIERTARNTSIDIELEHLEQAG